MKGGNSGAAVIAGDPAKSNLLRYIDLPENDSKHMPPKGKTPVSDDERLILNWWVEAGAPENKTVGQLTLPDDVQLAMDRNVPAAIREKQEAAKRAEVAQLAGVVAGLQKRVPGSLRALAPGETALEFSAALDPGRFGDAQLRELAAVAPDLVVLDLRGTRVTDAGMGPLASMTNLKRLQLQETNITDAGLTGIKTLPKLEVLNLYATHVTDAGVATLASSTKLKRLYIWRTGVTDAGAAKLNKALPKLEIVKADPPPQLSVAAGPAPGATVTPKAPTLPPVPTSRPAVPVPAASAALIPVKP